MYKHTNMQYARIFFWVRTINRFKDKSLQFNKLIKAGFMNQQRQPEPPNLRQFSAGNGSRKAQTFYSTYTII